MTQENAEITDLLGERTEIHYDSNDNLEKLEVFTQRSGGIKEIYTPSELGYLFHVVDEFGEKIISREEEPQSSKPEAFYVFNAGNREYVSLTLEHIRDGSPDFEIVCDREGDIQKALLYRNSYSDDSEETIEEFTEDDESGSTFTRKTYRVSISGKNEKHELIAVKTVPVDEIPASVRGVFEAREVHEVVNYMNKSNIYYHAISFRNGRSISELERFE